MSFEKEGLGKSRLESLSDGIFAFAMTLLVISLAVPVIPKFEAPRVLPGLIAGMYSEFLIFSIAFFILAGYWLSHHRILQVVEYVDERLVWLNILLLFFVVLIPLTTSISGDYDNVLEAVLLFHANILCASLLLTLIWLYIRTKRGKLIRDDQPGTRPQGTERAGWFRALTIPGVAILAIGISLVDPARSMWCYLLIPLVLGIGGRLQARKGRPS